MILFRGFFSRGSHLRNLSGTTGLWIYSVFRMSFALCSRPWQVIERRTPLYHELDGLASNPITCTFFLTLFQFVIEKLSANANNKQRTDTLFESRGSRSPFQVFQHWSIQRFAILFVTQGGESFVNQFISFLDILGMLSLNSWLRYGLPIAWICKNGCRFRAYSNRRIAIETPT